MRRVDFEEFYAKTIKKYAEEFVAKHNGYELVDAPGRIYEEYLNQKTLMKVVLDKNRKGQLLDRHKVCGAMTVAIIKCRPLICNKISDDDGDFGLAKASKINEQIAFYSSFSLLLSFIEGQNSDGGIEKYVLPPTYHNENFADTFTRALFLANVQNSLCPELLANIFFLLERYNELALKGNENLLEQ